MCHFYSFSSPPFGCPSFYPHSIFHSSKFRLVQGRPTQVGLWAIDQLFLIIWASSCRKPKENGYNTDFSQKSESSLGRKLDAFGPVEFFKGIWPLLANLENPIETLKIQFPKNSWNPMICKMITRISKATTVWSRRHFLMQMINMGSGLTSQSPEILDNVSFLGKMYSWFCFYWLQRWRSTRYQKNFTVGPLEFPIFDKKLLPKLFEKFYSLEKDTFDSFRRQIFDNFRDTINFLGNTQFENRCPTISELVWLNFSKKA
jgi:hypothetical protein